MVWTTMLRTGAALLLSLPAIADPGTRLGERPAHAKKQRFEKDSQISNRGQILFIGGHRVSEQHEVGEAWRRDKAQAHRDDKARRDRDAQERLGREEARRAGVHARREREKLAAQARRDAEKSRREEQRQRAAKKKGEATRR